MHLLSAKSNSTAQCITGAQQRGLSHGHSVLKGYWQHHAQHLEGSTDVHCMKGMLRPRFLVFLREEGSPGAGGVAAAAQTCPEDAVRCGGSPRVFRASFAQYRHGNDAHQSKRSSTSCIIPRRGWHPLDQSRAPRIALGVQISMAMAMSPPTPSPPKPLLHPSRTPPIQLSSTWDPAACPQITRRGPQRLLSTSGSSHQWGSWDPQRLRGRALWGQTRGSQPPLRPDRICAEISHACLTFTFFPSQKIID